jgi:hypothetical protein
MTSTSPRHGRHARVAPRPATRAPEAAQSAASPRRKRRAELLVLILAPVAAGLVTLALVGMHVINQPVHVTADASQQHVSATVDSGMPNAVRCCVSLAASGATASSSAPPRHHAAKRHASHRDHTASTPASSPAAVSTGGDSSSWPASVAGWRLTYSTDFPGSSLPSGWGAYSGEPGGDPDGNWVQSNAQVSGGALRLMATPSSQAGVSFYGKSQTYGMYLVRMKGDDEPGLAINNIAILWPAQQGVWPPEIDFYEDSGGSRQGFSASLHAGSDGNDNPVIHSSPPANNGTAWHTYGVQWTPSAITYTIDGRVWGSVSRSSVGSGQWPAIPMNLTLQSQNQSSAQPSGTIETMTVAWVAEYAMS